MEYRIEPAQSVKLTINAKDRYSPETLLVSANDIYEFYCDPAQQWTDWFIRSNADGFTNVLANLAGLRLRGIKCFTLCGCYNRDEKKLFPIGTTLQSKMTASGSISFFANDAFKYYSNNKGSITLIVKRIS